jgi:hypothetical protein
VRRFIGLGLYWTAVVVAATAGVIAAIGAAFGDSDNRFVIAGLLCAFGFVIWLIGFGCRKALSDQPSPGDRD